MQMLIRRALSCRGVYACISKKQADFIMEVMDMPELEIPGNAKKKDPVRSETYQDRTG